MNTFKPGRTYTARSLCDHECIYSMTVISRTAKTIRADTGMEGVRTLHIRPDYDGHESVRPFGNYSMATTMHATGDTP